MKSPQNIDVKRTQRLLFTGFCMGLADLVPGVSGGTIAFLYGIYDELLFSIRTVTGKTIKLIARGKFKEALSTIPFAFLVPLAIGILTAIFGLVHLVTYLLDNHATYVWSFFFGLVLGSVVVISKRVEKWNLNRALLLLAAFSITFGVLGLPVLDTQETPLVLFLTGAIAITAMILPGISGSLIMVILGQYKTVINSVADRKIADMFYFACGAAVGIALFSRLLSWLLKNHHTAVIATMIGIMLGSLRRVWPWQTELSDGTYVNNAPEWGWPVAGSIALGLFAFALVWYLEKLGVAREHDDIDDKEFVKEMKSQHD
jgi:putative membrane protein